MYFLIEDEDLLKKYNTIGIKSVLISKKKRKINSEPDYNTIIWKPKYSHVNEVIDFYNEEAPKLDCNHTCLAVITLDSVLKKRTFIIRNYFKENANILRKN